MGPLYACADCRYEHHACGRCGAAVDASPHAGLMDAHGATIHRCNPLTSARAPEPHECTCGATVYYWRLRDPWLDADGERHRHAPPAPSILANPQLVKNWQVWRAMARYGGDGG